MQPNREMRRIAARQKPYAAPKRIALPRHLDEQAVFADIESVLEKLEHGAIEHVDGKPVMRAGNGDWYEVVPAMNGWISAWKGFDAKFNLNHDLSAMVRVCNCLHNAMPLTMKQVQGAKSVLAEQRKLFRRINRDELAGAARTEQIRLYLS